MLVNAPHPVLACAAIEAALQEVAGVEPAFMRTGEKADALLTLTRVQTALAALRMRIIAAAEDVAEETGARDAAAWLAHETHASLRSCRTELHLPDDLDPALLVQAEEYLVEAAGHYGPDQLRVLGRKILDV